MSAHVLLGCLLAAFAAGAAASEHCTARENLIDDSTRETIAIYSVTAPASVTLVDGRRIEVQAGTAWAEIGRISLGEVYAQADSAPGMMLVVSIGHIVGTFDPGAETFCAVRVRVPLRLRWIESR